MCCGRNVFRFYYLQYTRLLYTVSAPFSFWLSSVNPTALLILYQYLHDVNDEPLASIWVRPNENDERTGYGRTGTGTAPHGLKIRGTEEAMGLLDQTDIACP